MSAAYAVTPVAHVTNARREAIDDEWDGVESVIELDTAVVGAGALTGLDSFSHVEIVFLFHKVDAGRVEYGLRHPRGRADWPEIGIFAQRGKDRPNRIGTTVCRIGAVEGPRLTVRGLDAIDGTPVLDIKPVLTGFLPRGEVREPGWAREIMADYW